MTQSWKSLYPFDLGLDLGNEIGAVGILLNKWTYELGDAGGG